MFKITIKIILLISLVIILIIVGISSGVINISRIDAGSSDKGVLFKIKEIGNLQLTGFNLSSTIADTVKKDTLVKIKFPSEGKMLALINGEVNACINFELLKEKDIKQVQDTTFILLPDPVLCNARINSERSKIYDHNFNSHPLNQEDIEKIFPGTMNNLKAEAIRMGILDLAKENAKKILSVLLPKKNKNEIVVFKFED